MRRTQDFLVLTVLLVLLARHVQVAAYVHPYGDDLSYAMKGHLQGFWEGLVQEHRTWNGRYFSNILVLHGPMALGMEKGLPLYRMVPVLLMAGFVLAAFVLLRTVLRDVLAPRLALIVALAFLLSYLHLMPHAGEGLYWYTGAVTYLVPCILSLLHIAFLFSWCRGQGILPGWLLLPLVLLLTAAIVGSNEVAMAHVLIVQAMALVLVGRGTGRMMLWGLLGWAMLCALVVYMAPGNDVREAHFIHTRELLRTVVHGTAQTVRFTGWWMLSPVFLFCALLVLQWGRGVYQERGMRAIVLDVDRRLVLAIPLSFVFVAVAMPYWSTGILGQHRTVNAALFMFLPLACWVLLVWDAQVWYPRGWGSPLSRPVWRGWMLGGLVIALLVLRHDGDVTNDLLSGRLARYDAQCLDRYARTKEAIAQGKDVVDVPFLRDPPRSLGVLDLSPHPGHWMNTSLAWYLGDEALRVRPVVER